MLATSYASVRVCVLCFCVCQANLGAQCSIGGQEKHSITPGLLARHTEIRRGLLRVTSYGHSLWPNSGTPPRLPVPPASPQAHPPPLLRWSGLRSTHPPTASVPWAAEGRIGRAWPPPRGGRPGTAQEVTRPRSHSQLLSPPWVSAFLLQMEGRPLRLSPQPLPPCLSRTQSGAGSARSGPSASTRRRGGKSL